MTRVLVVDDDPQLLRALSTNLRARKYDVRTASTGSAAVRAISSEVPDVIILDLGLPDIGGDQVLASIRAWSQVPVVMLTARSDPSDKVAALDGGADDYITKPFSMPELLARLRVALRHAQRVDTDPVVTAGELHIDIPAGQVHRSGVPVHLTPIEWSLLTMLIRADGQLVTRDDLLREIWGPSYTGQHHYLRVYVAQLRRKLEADPARPQHLITESGRGYRFIRRPTPT